MADKKITELSNIAGADLSLTDEFVVVDISADETKAISTMELRSAIIPSLTTTQKNALINRAGMQVFDTTLGKMCFNTGSAWETITSS
tara:strand:+ start:216 stop:479 length:264 start_codon:yes stop_codon:yes gene_type:complete